jgi:hypothetical protein
MENHDTDITENYACNNSSVAVCVFVAAVKFLPSFCLATRMGHTRGGIYELLRWNGPRCHDIHTRRHKYWLKHLTVDKGIHRHTDSEVSP